ncbi:pupal cuticle protein Edg-78E-like [Phlebotomus argentipes]|uniref:pupal cuticle protein Edg-78E-like n=1 Tax=Phlebotomus argentipes TaxID=94469 RepID=UPI0028934058|nr:pupal cuticle protein Edg-78E-like [Phlebotomus argentipes]
MFKLFVFCALIVAITADHIDRDARVLDQRSEVNPDGTYQYSYQTSNGIAVQENGVGGHLSQGVAQWYTPEGTPITLQWRADENGYQPSGDHLPTPPPVPSHVLRALEWIRTHPQREEPVRRFF